MKPANRAQILEKMDPKKAAATSIGMKDMVAAKDSGNCSTSRKINH